MKKKKKMRIAESCGLVALLLHLTLPEAHAGSVGALWLGQDVVTGGFPVTATVRVGPVCHPGPCEEEDVFVALESSHPAATVFAYVDVSTDPPASGTFTITTHPVTAPTEVVITASADNGTPKSATLLVLPPWRRISEFTLEPADLYGGVPVRATIKLEYPADPNGWTVDLAVSQPPGAPAVTTPADVSFASGQNRAVVYLATHQVSSTVSAMVTATSAGVSKTVSLTVFPGALNLKIRKIEATQAIQYLDDADVADNAIMLVRNKPLVVRVFLEAEVTGPGAPVLDIPEVRVRLYRRPATSTGSWTAQNTALWPAAQVRPGESALTTRNSPNVNDPPGAPRRGNVSFLVPTVGLDAVYDFKAEVNPPSPHAPLPPDVPLAHTPVLPPRIEETNYDDNTTELHGAQFHETNDLHVKFFRIDYCPGCPGPGADHTKPAWSTRFPIIDYLEQVYPVDRVDSSKAHHEINVVSTTWCKDFKKECTWQWVFAKLEAYWLAAGAPARTYYYALLDHGVPHGNVGGRASTDGPWAFGLADVDDSGGIAAQEIAHLMYRWHAPCPADDPPPHQDSNWPATTNPRAIIAQTGFDAGRKLALPGNDGNSSDDTGADLDENKDFMSACRPKWVSPYTYCALYNERFRQAGPSCPSGEVSVAAPASHPAPKVEPTRAAATADHVGVNGFVEEDGEVHFGDFPRLSLPSRTPTPPGTGPYTIRLLGRAGRPLLERRFDLTRIEQSRRGGGFFQAVPFPTGTTAIVLSRDGRDLATRRVSAHSPVVRVTLPKGGESFAAQPVSVSWTAFDEDRDTLTFSVDYSADGGASWEPVATDLTDTRYEIDPSQLAGSRRAKVRVVASDGVNRGQADSTASFIVAKKSPEVEILLPRDKTLEAETAVLLRGEAADAEDGLLADEALTWMSDRQGVLGTGRRIVAVLSPGPHRIRLIAKDSDGNTSTAEVRLHVR